VRWVVGTVREEDGEEARLLRRGLVSNTGDGFVSYTGDGTESFRPGEVGGCWTGAAAAELLLEGRRKFGRRLCPFRWSSEPCDSRTAFPLARQPNDSISCWIGRWACSHSWMTCSMGGDGEGKCSCWQ
jgi:hypothetical protein